MPNFKIIPQHQIGNEYINGCNCFIGGDGPNITYYIMKYTTKNQNEFENLGALHLSAFHKWVSWESNLLDNVDINIKTNGLIKSLTFLTM
jgi:hypothetical protein